MQIVVEHREVIMAFGLKKNKVLIELDAAELSTQQIRLIKSINAILANVVTTDSEEDFFEGSAEFMRMCASLIKQANFAENLKGIDGIPYAEQALEYSMDMLTEHITNSKVVHYDN